MDTGEGKSIKSIEKAAAVIDLLADSAAPLPLSHIASELKMAKSTLHGIISTLVDVGYVAQDAETGRYFLSLRLFEIGSTVSRKWNERNFAYPFMQKLAESTGNTVHLAMLDDGEVLYIGKYESSGSAPLATDIGIKLPAHCTAIGKVLLSCLSPYELKKFVRRRGLERYTNSTITDIEILQSELDKIRAQGFASDEQEYMVGLRCVAVPIYNSKGEVTTALSVAGPVQKLQGREFEKRKQLLFQISSEISGLLGYRGESEKTCSPDMRFAVIAHHQGKEYRMKCSASESVYKAVSRSGYDWAWSGCAGGGCGICKVEITAGAVTYRRMSCEHVADIEKAQGIALACCIIPASDLELVICGA